LKHYWDGPAKNLLPTYPVAGFRYVYEWTNNKKKDKIYTSRNVTPG